MAFTESLVRSNEGLVAMLMLLQQEIVPVYNKELVASWSRQIDVQSCLHFPWLPGVGLAGPTRHRLVQQQARFGVHAVR